MRTMKNKNLRTVVYIDGFNLYYGALRGTSWKWLDLPAFCSRTLGPQNQILAVKYYTATVRPTPRDPDANRRQEAYHRALRAHCPTVEFHFGHFLRHQVTMENANPPPARVDVWKTEEKGSDVNLALHVLDDAWKNAYDCAVVVSNDSDLAEALRLVRTQHHKVVGVLTPGAPLRKTSWQLRQYAHFVKPIRTWALESSQLPDPVPGTAIRKPVGW